MSNDNAIYPLHVFRFHVDFAETRLDDTGNPQDVPLCSGAFAECTGLEATMEPKVIKEGGRNYGAAQRSGPVSFATIVLKRGMTTTHELWKWFSMATEQGAYAHRMSVSIAVHDHSGTPAFAFKLARALPIKFKSADLNAKGGEVGIEEIHLAHEGLTLVDLAGTQ